MGQKFYFSTLWPDSVTIKVYLDNFFGGVKNERSSY